MKISEMKQAVYLLHEEWNLGKKEAKAEGNICAWIYLMGILEESEAIVTYKEKGKLIGFAGYAKWKSKKHLLRKKLAKIFKIILSLSSKIKDKKGFKQYSNSYDNYMPKKYDGYFDGEVSILIVKKEYRGKGIGENLLLEIFQLAKNDNMKNLSILTDDSCNYKFYEKHECNQVYKTKIKNFEKDKLGNIQEENAYVYERKLT